MPDTDLSDHCLSDHFAELPKTKDWEYPKGLIWSARRAAMLVDRKMHFTGPFGGLWKILGVTRSPKNPNVCNLCGYHWEAGRLTEVTVLFADCRGFTSLMEERGPEVVRPLVDQFFRRCRTIAVKQDGIVDHFLGDAVMALFNVPIRHEDHVLRAVQAAIDIQQSVGDLNKAAGQGDVLQVGIGITTGLAVTGTVGSTSCSDYTALGNAVNLAARLQSAAAGGEVLAEQGVYEKAKDRFPGAEERVLTLKGLKEPVKAYLIPYSATAGHKGDSVAAQV